MHANMRISPSKQQCAITRRGVCDNLTGKRERPRKSFWRLCNAAVMDLACPDGATAQIDISATVEPLLYDHPQNPIGVVV